MRGDDVRAAIEAEVARWPGASVTFEGKGRGAHPKARLEFAPAEGPPLIMRRAYSDQSEDPVSILRAVKDMRGVLTQMGAAREEEPTTEGDEAAVKQYHKPNEGRAKRDIAVDLGPARAKPTIADQLVDHPAAPRPRAIEEVGRLFGDVESYEEVETTDEERAAQRAATEAAAEAIVDGVYFGLPFEVYRRVKRLNGSGMQKLAVSAGTFWKGSWLDPNQPVEDEDETKARILGKAYHLARLEPQLFETTYCRKLDKADFPARGLLTSDAAVKAELKAAGETQTIGTESIVERCERLLDTGYEGTIWPLELAKWKAQLNGRVPLDAKDWDAIVTDMERLRGNDDIAAKLTGGASEVSIFWTDRYGIQMKARLDYLRPDLWDEFKTFDNTRGKALRQALADAVRYNRYHIQVVTQRDAIEAVRVGGLQIVGDASDAQRELIASIQMRPGELACWFIFQEKGGVPNLLARQFHFFHVPMNTKLGHAGASEEAIARVEEAARTKTGLHIRAIGDIDRAKREFVLYSQVYRPGEPWAPVNPVGDFEDSDFNRYWLEGHYD